MLDSQIKGRERNQFRNKPIQIRPIYFWHRYKAGQWRKVSVPTIVLKQLDILACCDSWGGKELDATELNWTDAKKKNVPELITHILYKNWASLATKLVKNMPAMQDTLV